MTDADLLLAYRFCDMITDSDDDDLNAVVEEVERRKLKLTGG